MFLSGEKIRGMTNNGLVEGYESLDKQLTPNGFDLRIGAIIEIREGGVAGDTRKECGQPEIEKVYTIRGIEEWIKRESGLCVDDDKVVVVGEGESIRLKRDRHYLGVTIERVNMPDYLIGVLQSRSTMFRMAGIFLGTGFVEAGYRGRLTIGIYSPSGGSIRMGSRFVQIAFSTLVGRGSYDEQEKRHYQNGRII